MIDEEVAQRALLKKHPAWPKLRAHYEAERTRAVERFGRKVVHRGDAVSEVEAAEIRGFWKGVFAILDNPERAETQILESTGEGES